MAKKTVLGILRHNEVIGYVQYKNDTEVEIWFKEGKTPEGGLKEKFSKKNIGLNESEAERVTLILPRKSGQVTKLQILPQKPLG